MNFARIFFFRFVPLFCLLLAAGGCDLLESRLGLENPAKKAARLEAEGKAVGGACRQSGRAIEDCYSIYTWVPKEAVFAGWLEMDQYMRENHLDTVVPLLPPAPPPDTDNKKKKKTAPPADAENTPSSESGEAGGNAENAVPAAAAPAPIPVPVPVPVPRPVPQPVPAAPETGASAPASTPAPAAPSSAAGSI